MAVLAVLLVLAALERVHDPGAGLAGAGLGRSAAQAILANDTGHWLRIAPCSPPQSASRTPHAEIVNTFLGPVHGLFEAAQPPFQSEMQGAKRGNTRLYCEHLLLPQTAQ
jgi:hypothetical protein